MRRIVVNIMYIYFFINSRVKIMCIQVANACPRLTSSFFLFCTATTAFYYTFYICSFICCCYCLLSIAITIEFSIVYFSHSKNYSSITHPSIHTIYFTQKTSQNVLIY